ncbi:MAG: ADP-ribosylation factor-like protein [Candidatus Helarchaeota archaeon]
MSNIPVNIKKAVDIPKKIKNIEEIKNLDIIHIKGIGKKTAQNLKNALKITKITDLAKKKISHDELLKLKTLGIKKFKFSKWVYIAKLIEEAKSEEVAEAVEPRKISVVGLENAGKTTILQVLKENIKIEMLLKMPPTIGAEQVTITKVDSEWILWDMGGQVQFRKEYLENAEKYFTNVDMVIYVFDIQDREKFQPAISYLKEIVKEIINLKEKPEFLIILHKLDPDVKDKEDTKSALQFLSNQVKDIFEDLDFKFEIVTYSIYNYLGANKNIVNEIRNVLTSTPAGTEKTEFLSTSLERIMNMFINLSASIEDRFTNLEILVENIRQWVDYFKETISLTPVIPKKEPGIIEKLEDLGQVKTIRTELREELKSVLKLRKAE